MALGSALQSEGFLSPSTQQRLRFLLRDTDDEPEGLRRQRREGCNIAVQTLQSDPTEHHRWDIDRCLVPVPVQTVRMVRCRTPAAPPRVPRFRCPVRRQQFQVHEFYDHERFRGGGTTDSIQELDPTFRERGNEVSGREAERRETFPTDDVMAPGEYAPSLLVARDDGFRI